MDFTNHQTSILARSVLEHYGDASHAVNILLPHGGTSTDLVRVLQQMVSNQEHPRSSALHRGLLDHALDEIIFEEVADYVLNRAAEPH